MNPSAAKKGVSSGKEAPRPHRMPRILIVTHGGFPQSQVEEIRAQTPDADYITATDEQVLERAVELDALIGCPRRAFSEALFERNASTLRWVHATGAGVEEFLIPRFVQSDIVFTNGKIIQGPEVADHAMALLLALARNIHFHVRGESPKHLPRPIELRGKTALVVGLGGIGMLIAERAAAFGMRVFGLNPQPVPMLGFIAGVFPPDRLQEALPLADAVLVATPLTELTIGLFGRKEFECMKPEAYFIAVSRGQTVRTNDLLQALRRKRIAAAGLDVTEPEPLAEDHPLRSLPNVILTPHIAGLSDQNRRRSFELVKTNVERFVRGLPLLNIVDKKLGY
jgi:phosphoglycerate dehydrogenase-like enzyme